MKSAPSASAPKAPPVQSVPGDKQNLGKYRDEVERLQLESNALDLDLNGFTVVEDVLDPDLTARGLEATLCTFGERTGTRPDVKTGKDYDGYHVQRYLLLKDPAYEEIVMAEKVLALVGMDTWNGWNDNQDDWAKPWGQRDRTRYKPSVG